MQAAHGEAEAAIRSAWERGDYDTATTLLLRAYADRVLGFLIARVGSESDAAECFSVFAEDAWHGMAGFQWRCSALAWAFALARRASDRTMRAPHRRASRNVPLSQAGEAVRLAVQVRDATLGYLRTATKTRMQELREQLAEEEQTLIMLRIDQSLSWRELAMVVAPEGAIADEAALSREAARLRKRFQLAKDKLRALAEAEGLLG